MAYAIKRVKLIRVLALIIQIKYLLYVINSTSRRQGTRDRECDSILTGISQTDLADGIGSNACIVISVYTALKFLGNEIEFDDGAINESTITQYTEFMIEGKTVYDIINPPVIQPNLFVEEVIKTVDFPFEYPTATDIVSITDEAQF